MGKQRRVPVRNARRNKQIKRRFSRGEGRLSIAKDFGLTTARISQIALGLGARPRHRGTRWPDDDIVILKKNYNKTLSATLIAEQLNTTRNAVIGKANRMGLSEEKV